LKVVIVDPSDDVNVLIDVPGEAAPAYRVEPSAPSMKAVIA
jgi:hypothetical protein